MFIYVKLMILILIQEQNSSPQSIIEKRKIYNLWLHITVKET